MKKSLIFSRGFGISGFRDFGDLGNFVMEVLK